MVITYFWLIIYQSITRRFIITIIKLEPATRAIKLLAIMKLFNKIVYDKK